MAFGSFDNSPPPFFRQGASSLSRLMVFIALGLFLMVADVRWGLTNSLRSVIQTVLRPIESVLELPSVFLAYTGSYLMGAHEAREENEQLRAQLLRNSIKVQSFDDLVAENQRMRGLLELGTLQGVKSKVAAEVIKKIPDSYSEKILVGRGSNDGVKAGAPVISPFGVVGQVTRVFPFSSEVTLVNDRSYVISVLNARTQKRGVAYGSPYAGQTDMELRFVLGSADLEVGDLLMTSGIDGIYPPGLHVAKVSKIERRVNSTFAKVHLIALGRPTSGRQVLILEPHGFEPSSTVKSSREGQVGRVPTLERTQSEVKNG